MVTELFLSDRIILFEKAAEYKISLPLTKTLGPVR